MEERMSWEMDVVVPSKGVDGRRDETRGHNGRERVEAGHLGRERRGDWWENG